jgi:hypothetical protein
MRREPFAVDARRRRLAASIASPNVSEVAPALKPGSSTTLGMMTEGNPLLGAFAQLSLRKAGADPHTRTAI